MDILLLLPYFLANPNSAASDGLAQPRYFEVLQKQRFERNVPWIKKSSRERILHEMNEGLDRARACLLLFTHHCTDIPELARRLRRIRHHDVDISVAEVNGIFPYSANSLTSSKQIERN
jgi:hypothetical protein